MISRKRNRLGSRLFRSKRIEIENLEPRIVLDSTVVFNEIMYNPIGENDSQTEWIELFNQLNVDMDISEWQLAGAVDYSFPEGTVVPGRGHLVIASDPQALSDSGAYSDAVGPWEGQLSNSGEEILLYNNDGRLMNAVDYDDAGGWPSAADGGGSTLSKADAFAGSHLPESWTFSPQIGGTIGIQNFIRPGTFRSENIFEEATARAMVPTNGDLGLTWTAEGFDDSGWAQAKEYTEDEIGPKEPFYEHDFKGAKWIWSDDLKLDNTVIFRFRVDGPKATFYTGR